MIATALDGTHIRLTFSEGISLSPSMPDPSHHVLSTEGAFPASVRTCTPEVVDIQSGTNGVPVDTGSPITYMVDLTDGTLLPSHVGTYVFADDLEWARVEEVLSPTVVRLDKPIYLAGLVTRLTWRHTTAIQSALLETSPMTNGGEYVAGVSGLRTASGADYEDTAAFVATSQLPRVVSAEQVGDDQVLIGFSTPMRGDAALTSLAEYTVSGLVVKSVSRVSDTQVVLRVVGLSEGSATVTVNASGTPKDLAGNPLDPVFNTVVFTSSTPLAERSVFTDKGPITKPAEILQSGTGATLDAPDEATLPGSAIISDYVGLYVRLYVAAPVPAPPPGLGAGGLGSGPLGGVGAPPLPNGSLDYGTYRISARLSSTQIRIQASFTIPDPYSGQLFWQILDPRTGQIADDPSDVTVRVNGAQVVPSAVVGLLGQVVLPSVPAPDDDVRVDYCWICNPTVDFRRLNSKEFRLNCWDRDRGTYGRHWYRFNNTLIRPSSYVAADVLALQDQPLRREMHYRAYERAYTAALNDPSLLLFNSPIHKIAYPPLQRPVAESFIRYEALTLPESDPADPWTRKGGGTASLSGGYLVVEDDSGGPFPTGKPLFWTRRLDLSFPSIFAFAWRVYVTEVQEPDGVFTGVAVAYSDEQRALVVGYLNDGGMRKFGVLRAGYGDDPSSLSAWTGGIDTNGNPTGLPADVDWSDPHVYRVYRDRDRVVRVYLDGDITEILRVVEDDLPFLEELNAPFDQLEGVAFGSLSRPARNVSRWDYVRYLTLPTNPAQMVPSIFVQYEGDVLPEAASSPWTPVGYHGAETLLPSDLLLLDSTSATDPATEAQVGLVGGDFKGFFRLEPLLAASADVILDASLQVVSCTHGPSPDAIMAAVDDGTRLAQVCVFPDRAVPKVSYGGRSLPEDFSPTPWQSMGTSQASMVGRLLRILDDTTTDGLVYYRNDSEPDGGSTRILGSNDYAFEFRCKVVSYSTDPGGFAGAMMHVYDSLRSVGVMLTDVAGVRGVDLHSDGISVATFPFDWFDGVPHTYRIRKNLSGDLVSLFVDGQLLGTLAYSSFLVPPPDPVGQVSFGSATSSSFGSTSVVDWNYANAWRVEDSLRKYVGLRKGHDEDTLVGYHLPTKATGRQADVVGNALGDPQASFLAGGVVGGDRLVVDVGPNKGVYEIAAVPNPNTLTVIGVFPATPSKVDYRIVREIDWTVPHRYRMVRDPGGGVSLFVDAEALPSILVGYDADLPPSSVGVPRVLGGGLASVSFGAFDPTNLSQTIWDFVRYAVTRSVNETRIVPHHQFLNQWNVIASPEHLRTPLPHTHTGYMSCSTGIPPNTDPDFLADPSLDAYTILNEGTPLVPLTQTYDIRRPTPVQVPVSAFNRIEDLFNNDGDFLLNDASNRVELLVPDDVLYNSLDVIEQDTGVEGVLTPACDGCSPDIGTVYYQNRVCLVYEGTVLPEQDPAAQTPWKLVSDDPLEVVTSIFGGVLTYGTTAVGTKTIYRNDTALPDYPGLQTEVAFRIKVLNDTTLGMGDTQIRFGLSAPGFTVALAFVTTPVGERYVLVKDMNKGTVVGGITFDFLDGAFHTYRIVKNIGGASVNIFVDS